MTDGPTLVDLDAPAPAVAKEGRFLPWLWVAVGALLIAAVVSAFVVDGEATGAERIAAAAEGVDDSGTFAYELTLEASGALGTTFGLTGTVDAGAGRSASTLQVGGNVIETVADGDQLYVQVPEAARERFGGKAWARVDAASLATGLGGVSPTATPLQTFEQLRNAGEVEEVGKELVRGTPTTHLRAVVDLSESVPERPGAARIRQALRAVEVDVWLDDDDRIRRHRTTLDLAGAAGVGTTMGLTTTIETFDFGKAASIEVPPADQVADAGADVLSSLFAEAPPAPPAD